MGPIRSGRFVRRPDSYHRYESAWSCLNKFVYQNRFALRDVIGLVAERSGDKPVTWGRLNQDLNTAKGFDFDRLARALEIEVNQAELMFTDRWLLPQKPLTSIWLRFCPTCIASGFHTPLFQYNLFLTCPWHKLSLEDRCPSCHHPVDYTFGKESTLHPYGCKRCGNSLWNEISTWNWPRITGSEREGVLESYLTWRDSFNNSMTGWNKEVTPSYNLFDERSPEDPGTSSIEFWAHCHLPMPPALRAAFPRPPNTRTVTFIRGARAQRKAASNAEPDKKVLLLIADRYIGDDCTAVIKAINRQLKKQLFRKHRMCMRGSYRPVVEGPTRSRSLVRHVFVCPWHEAYLCWHAHWFSRPDSATGYATLSPRLDARVRHWAGMVTSMSSLERVRWITRRLLGEEALSVFRESHLHARSSFEEGYARLRPQLVVKRKSEPHFYIHRNGENSDAIFIAYPLTVELLQGATSYSKSHGVAMARARSEIIHSIAVARPGAHIEGYKWRL